MEALNRKQVQALEALWQQYSRLLFALADACCADPNEADEVVHDVVLRLARQIDRLAEMPEEVLRRYLARAIRNEAVSHGRRNSRQAQLTLPLEDEHMARLPAGETAEEALLAAEEVRHIMNLLEKLPEKERTALRMKRLEHATDEEIAKTLGIQPSGVRQYVRRAKKKLAKLYGEEDLT